MCRGEKFFTGRKKNSGKNDPASNEGLLSPLVLFFFIAVCRGPMGTKQMSQAVRGEFFKAVMKICVKIGLLRGLEVLLWPARKQLGKSGRR